MSKKHDILGIFSFFSHKKYNWQFLKNSPKGFLLILSVILETKWNIMVNKYASCIFLPIVYLVFCPNYTLAYYYIS